MAAGVAAGVGVSFSGVVSEQNRNTVSARRTPLPNPQAPRTLAPRNNSSSHLSCQSCDARQQRPHARDDAVLKHTRTHSCPAVANWLPSVGFWESAAPYGTLPTCLTTVPSHTHTRAPTRKYPRATTRAVALRPGLRPGPAVCAGVGPARPAAGGGPQRTGVCVCVCGCVCVCMCIKSTRKTLRKDSVCVCGCVCVWGGGG